MRVHLLHVDDSKAQKYAQRSSNRKDETANHRHTIGQLTLSKIQPDTDCNEDLVDAQSKEKASYTECSAFQTECQSLKHRMNWHGTEEDNDSKIAVRFIIIVQKVAVTRFSFAISAICEGIIILSLIFCIQQLTINCLHFFVLFRLRPIK